MPVNIKIWEIEYFFFHSKNYLRFEIYYIRIYEKSYRIIDFIKEYLSSIT